MSGGERSPLDDLASAVSDGKPIDWDGTSSHATGELIEDIAQLRIIAGIADLHRQLLGNSQDETIEAGVAERVRMSTPALEGPRWGPLVIRAKLGSGAFGDVFKAWDTTLDREVALKVLRARARSSGADSIVREGQMLARITHPNVMKIYGAQEVDGHVGIWGEFLHGRTLARIVAEDGPLSADEAQVVGDGITRALAAAHKVGVLHRDVKAQNVIREKGGRIVLMDFGLGRELARSTDGPGTELAGTPLYLAPELFDDGRASPQSDIYSLGVLLFYLVTGAFPVTGKSLEEIGQAHRKHERQRLQDLRPDLPTRFVQVVERALEPDPEKRFESAGAMQAAIAISSQSLPPEPEVRPSIRRWIAVAAALALAVASAATTAWTFMRPGEAPEKYTFSIEPPPGTTFSESSRNAPAISPDGRYVAMVATGRDGRISLWLQDLTAGTARRIQDSSNAQTPFWSPDSKYVAFFEPSGVLRMVGVAEGSLPARTIKTAAEPRGGAWNMQGVLLLTKGPRGGLFRRQAFADNEGTGERLVMAPEKSRHEVGLMWPQFLPDGERFIYFIFSDSNDVRGIYLGSLDNRTRKQLAKSDTSGVIVGDAIAFVQKGQLMKQAVDWSSGTPVGPPQVWIDDVACTFDFQTVASAASDGTLVYLPAVEKTELVWFNRAGKRLETLPLPAARYRNPTLSSDEQLLAVQRFEDTISRMEIYDLGTKTLKTSITQSAAVEASAWGPGHLLFYTSIESDRSDIYSRDLSTDKRHERLWSNDPGDDADKMPMDWSLRHKALTFVNLDRNGYSLWTLRMTTPPSAVAVNPGLGIQVGGRLSPDGTRIVYLRKESVDQTDRIVWMSDYPSGENRYSLNTGGSDPAWPSNTEVSFFNVNNRFVVVDARRPAGGVDARERVGFAPNIRTPAASRNNYVWSSNGQRVLMNVPVTPPEAVRIQVIVPRRSPGR